jgi:hypothetical protein
VTTDDPTPTMAHSRSTGASGAEGRIRRLGNSASRSSSSFFRLQWRTWSVICDLGEIARPKKQVMAMNKSSLTDSGRFLRPGKGVKEMVLRTCARPGRRLLCEQTDASTRKEPRWVRPFLFLSSTFCGDATEPAVCACGLTAADASFGQSAP